MDGRREGGREGWKEGGRDEVKGKGEIGVDLPSAFSGPRGERGDLELLKWTYKNIPYLSPFPARPALPGALPEQSVATEHASCKTPHHHPQQRVADGGRGRERSRVSSVSCSLYPTTRSPGSRSLCSHLPKWKEKKTRPTAAQNSGSSARSSSSLPPLSAGILPMIAPPTRSGPQNGKMITTVRKIITSFNNHRRVITVTNSSGVIATASLDHVSRKSRKQKPSWPAVLY